MPSAEESLILLGSSPGAVAWNIVGGDNPGDVPFQNNWTTPDDLYNVTTGLAAPHFRKVNNLVCIEGGMAGGAAQTVAFTLPENFRPQQTCLFLAPLVNGSVLNPGGFVQIAVLADGSVMVFNPLVFDPADEDTVVAGETGEYGVTLNGVFFTTTFG